MTGEEAGLADLWSRPVAVIKMAADGTVLEFSPEAEAMFGYTRDQAIGAKMSELIVPERLRAAHETGLARYLSGPDHPKEYVQAVRRFIGADGQHRIVASPSPADAPPGMRAGATSHGAFDNDGLVQESLRHMIAE